MVRISVLGDALKTMYNAEKAGKRQVLIRPASKVVIKFLQLMQQHGYIGEFELVSPESPSLLRARQHQHPASSTLGQHEFPARTSMIDPLPVLWHFLALSPSPLPSLSQLVHCLYMTCLPHVTPLHPGTR